MNKIKVELISEIDENSIDFANIAQTPILAFRKYFYADDEVWNDYLARHDLIIKFEEFKYINDLNEYIDNFIQDMNTAIIEDISHFDARLSGGMHKKTLQDSLTISDWEVIIYNISELNSHDRDKLKTYFFQVQTPSLFDFREFIGDNLVFTNCRKAIANRDNQLKIVRSKKNAYYPTSTTKDIKGCNFISAAQTIDMLSQVSTNIDVVYNKNGIEVTQSKEDILSREKAFYQKIEDDNKQYSENEATKILNELRSIQEINEEVKISAKEQIKIDKNQNRGSLDADSLNQQIYSSNIESPTLSATSELTTEDEILKEFDNEKEFLLIKKQKKDEFLYAKAIEVQDEAISLAYKLLNDGQSFKQMNNIINQKFAQNIFVVEIVNLHLSKQLKLAKVKDNQIDDLENYIEQIQKDMQKLENRAKAKEEETSKIRSTMQKKEIEYKNALDEKYKEIQEQENIAKEAIDTLEEMSKYKEEMDNIIIELDNDNSKLKEEIKQNKKDVDRLEETKKSSDKLEEEVKQLSAKLIEANEKMVKILDKK